jgi:hypothetical protein
LIKRIILCLLALMTAAMVLSGCQAQPSNESASLANASAIPAPQNDSLNSSGALTISDMKENATYENAQHKFSMTYPADWTAQEPDANDQGIVAGFLAPGEDMNNPTTYLLVQIEALPSSQKVTLPQYSQAVVKYLKEAAPGVEIRTENDMSISGNEGHAIEYSLASDNTTFRVLKAWTLIGENAYAFTFNAPEDRYDAFAGEIGKIIGSLKVI